MFVFFIQIYPMTSEDLCMTCMDNFYYIFMLIFGKTWQLQSLFTFVVLKMSRMLSGVWGNMRASKGWQSIFFFFVKYIFSCTNKAALFHFRVSDLDPHAGSVHSIAVTQWLIRTIQTRPWPQAFKHTHFSLSEISKCSSDHKMTEVLY